MCLLSIAWQTNPEYPFVFAGNRDEFHDRHSAAADWWDDAPDVLGGRDLVAGGTWLGVQRDGRFAVVTNRPHYPAPENDPLSRGALVAGWLNRPGTPQAEQNFIDRLPRQSHQYGGYSLVVGNIHANDSGQLLLHEGGYGINTHDHQTLQRGVHGLSNTAADNPWPKLNWLNEEIQQHVQNGPPDSDTLFALLGRQQPVPGDDNHGVPATPFIAGPLYGTRCSTVIIIDRQGHCRFVERRFAPEGAPAGESAFEF